MPKKKATSKRKTPAVQQAKGVSSSIALVRDGWAVIIIRKDGSFFFSASGCGVETPLWPHSQRSGACTLKRELREDGFTARVVRVRWMPPQIVPNVKDHATTVARDENQPKKSK